MTQDPKGGILGVSVVQDRLRIVEGKKEGNDFQVTRVAQGTLRQPFNYEALADKNMARRFAEDINRLCETEQFSEKRVAFSLDSSMVLVKKIPVDSDLSDEELSAQIDWEVRQFAISPVGEYIIDFERTQLSSTEPLTHILVVVVRKKIVQFLKEIFKHTSLKLKVIDVDVFSAQRALQLNYDCNNGDKIGLVDVEESKIHFSVLEGRNLFLTQDVIPPSSNGNPEDHSESRTRLISKELRRIVLDHQLGKSVEDFKEIFLYGEAVEDQVLEGLQNSYDVHIGRANPFRKLKILPEAKNDIGEGRSERFVISVGAALRGIQ